MPFDLKSCLAPGRSCSVFQENVHTKANFKIHYNITQNGETRSFHLEPCLGSILLCNGSLAHLVECINNARLIGCCLYLMLSSA